MKQLYKVTCDECEKESIYDRKIGMFCCRKCGSWVEKNPRRLEGQEFREAHKEFEKPEVDELRQLKS